MTFVNDANVESKIYPAKHTSPILQPEVNI